MLDDVQLAHLEVVLSRVLREGGQARLVWAVPSTSGSGRRAVTVTRQSPLSLSYRHVRPVRIDRDRLSTMLRAATTLEGLTLLPDDF